MTTLYWARYGFLGLLLLVVAYLVFLHFSKER
jgi:hypothetical protein